MAQGNEIIFELEEEVVKRLAGYPEITEDDLDDERYIYSYTAQDHVEHDLQEVHLTLVRAHLDSSANLYAEMSGDIELNRVIVANTPEGVRHLQPFSIRTFGDEDNPYEKFGISMWSRYSPVWLDWRYKHGGSGGSVVLDTTMQEWIEHARTALATVIPEIADAPVVIVSQFY